MDTKKFMTGMDGVLEINMMKKSWSLQTAWLKKDSQQQITLKPGGNSFITDCIVVKKKVTKKDRDIKVISGEKCFSQHRGLVDFAQKNDLILKQKELAKIKLWRLK